MADPQCASTAAGAHYNSNFKYLVFGDGHNDKDPLTDLDIVAHEYSHGVTYSYADMIDCLLKRCESFGCYHKAESRSPIFRW
ncbi:MAG TPA: hypothetical protein EYO35_08850 [Flavobacteriaceae bacterium]|nr:hypothetical protein [Flavobacteriaceae bacterium]